MAISTKQRSVLYDKFVPVIGAEEAQILLDQFPSGELDQPATKEFVGREIAATREFVRVEIAATRELIHKEVGALRSEVALRSDLHSESASLRSEMGSLRAEMGELRSEMRAEMGSLRSEVVAERREMHSQMLALDASVQGIRIDVHRKHEQFALWLIGAFIGQTAALGGLIAAFG